MLTTLARVKVEKIFPQFFACLKEGYTKETLLKDLFAGLSIGIISLPLVMAFSIAAGLPPERGLFTGVVAGFLISFLGGSRVQIGGPTGAFAVVIYSVVERHGYEGLVLATILAGMMMIVMALTNAGALLKFIPYPVVVGFTAGISVTIFSTQVKDFFGLPIEKAPAEFLEKWALYIEHFSAWNAWALGLGVVSLFSIFFLRKKYPKIPGAVAVVAAGTFIAYAFEFPLETIQTKFGSIPSTLPALAFPTFTLAQIQSVIPDAITIALLSSIESLLSAVVADKMTGFRHHSSTELFAHGTANIFSVLFGGIPATGAIARTAANARLGATTPLAGIAHAITLFILMFFFADVAAKIPLAILAAVLMFVAWNMSESKHIAMICKCSKSDIFMLLVTLLLTVLVDITVAVEIGIVLAALLFVKKMALNTKIIPSQFFDEHEVILKKHIPDGVIIYEVGGPLFFGIAESLHHQFLTLQPKPRAFIFRLNNAPLIDASGIHALHEVASSCKQLGIAFFISEIKEDNHKLFHSTGLAKAASLCTTLQEALAKTNVDDKDKASLESCT